MFNPHVCRMEVPVIVYTDKQSSRISPQILPTIIDTLIGDCKELYVLEGKMLQRNT